MGRLVLQSFSDGGSLLCGETSGLLFSLRNLFSASGVFLLLALNVRRFLFLHRLLAFVFRRFVAHEPKATV